MLPESGVGLSRKTIVWKVAPDRPFAITQPDCIAVIPESCADNQFTFEKIEYLLFFLPGLLNVFILSLSKNYDGIGIIKDYQILDVGTIERQTQLPYVQMYRKDWHEIPHRSTKYGI